MSFLNNWTVSIGDLCAFPIINALVVPVLASRNVNGWSLGGWVLFIIIMITPTFLTGVAVSVLAHRSWWHKDENLGHVFTGWYIGFSTSYDGRIEIGDNNWYYDLTKAGWVHFWYMVFQVAVVVAYIFTPMPTVAMTWVSSLLSMFFIIQNVQAVMIQRGNAPKFLFFALAEIFGVWAVALLKII